MLSDVRRLGGTPGQVLEPGEQLADGRFVIERSLGQGAMGVVYAAYDKLRARVLALKTMQLHGPDAAHALKQEFRALRDLVHPNLVRLHELFVDADQAYFTMDLVDGVPFDKLPRQQLKSALAQLVAAVQTLHQNGKLHRDLKPANVMIEAGGRLVVLDFGLVHDQARSLEAGATEAHGLVGTPRYMAPELMSWGKASERSDWYAVGVMLYETLTGEAPDAGGLARAMRREPPPAPSLRGGQDAAEFDGICQALLHPDPALRADGARLASALDLEPVSIAPSVRAPASTRLVGRESQLAHLSRVYAGHRARREPVAVFLSGLSGMGKTALQREFLRQHAHGALVLSGQCREQETVSHKAFDEVIDALSDWLLDRGADVALHTSPATASLLRLFPSLARVPALEPFANGEALGDPHAERSEAYAALGELLVSLAADRPLLIAIDDLQWGDLDSARLLFDLFANAERPNCFLWLSYRSNERDASPCLQRLLSGSRCLSDVIDVEEISVSELRQLDAEMLACTLLGVTDLAGAKGEERAKVHALCQEAQGSPLLLRELGSYLASLPAEAAASTKLGLDEVVRSRLQRVTEHGQELFRLLCLAGTPLREALLKSALGLPDVDAAVIQLEAERLVTTRASRSADALEVVHDGIAAAALRQLSSDSAVALHERLARAHKASDEPDIEALARHYAGAKLFGEAAHWAQKAAQRASASFAFDRAAQWYRSALDWGDLDQVTVRVVRARLADALAQAGRGAEAAAIYIEVADQFPAAEALDYRRRAADQWLVTGHIERGLEITAEVFTRVGMRLPRGTFAALLDLIGNRIAIKFSRIDYEPKDPSSIDPQALLRLDVCRAAWMLSFVSTLHGAALQARYLRIALKVGEMSRVAMGLGIEALQRFIEGNAGRGHELQSRARQLAERIETPQALGFQALVEGNCAYLAGEWVTCAERAELAEETLTRRCRGSTWELNTLRFFWSMSLYYQGRYRELRRRTVNWLLDAEDRGDLYAQACFRLNRARSLCLADDDPSRAFEDLARGLADWNLPGMGVHRFLAELARVSVHLYRADPEAAWQTLRKLWGEFRISSMRRVQLCRVHLRAATAFTALALAAIGDGNERAVQLRRAARHQRKLLREKTAWGNAQARYVSAQLALFGERRQSALRHFEEAVAELEERGMLAVAEGARYRWGLTLGGQEGEALQKRALSRIRAQGVREPERLLRMLAPGL